MEQTVESATRHHSDISEPIANEARTPGVSWPAVIAGAFVAAALSLILLALGAGVGFSSVSVWSNMGASVSTIGMTALLWLIISSAHTGSGLAMMLVAGLAPSATSAADFQANSGHVPSLAWVVGSRVRQ